MLHKKLLQSILFPLESQIHVASHLEVMAFSFETKMSRTQMRKSSEAKGSRFNKDQQVTHS